MKIKGTCFFSKKHNGHIIVFISEANAENKALLVPLSSIKFTEEGSDTYENNRCRPFDHSCVLNKGDIISNNNIDVLTKPTYVFYKRAEELPIKDIVGLQFNSDFEYRCDVSSDVLEKIQEGAKNTSRLQERFYKYFSYF